MNAIPTPTQSEAIKHILRPIEWHLSSSIPYRKNVVHTRRTQVYTVYPFLNDEMKARADKWLEDEKHTGLWD